MPAKQSDTTKTEKNLNHNAARNSKANTRGNAHGDIDTMYDKVVTDCITFKYGGVDQVGGGLGGGLEVELGGAQAGPRRPLAPRAGALAPHQATRPA